MPDIWTVPTIASMVVLMEWPRCRIHSAAKGTPKNLGSRPRARAALRSYMYLQGNGGNNVSFTVEDIKKRDELD